MVALQLLVVLFPAGLLAGVVPVAPRQQETPGLPDHCTITTTLPPITLTSHAPTSTADSGRDGHGGPGPGTWEYITVLPTLGPDGIGLHTYTVTYPCPASSKSPCNLPAPTDCPPGFTTTVTVCEVCGPEPCPVTLTVPVATASTPHSAPVPTMTSTPDDDNHGDHGEHDGDSQPTHIKKPVDHQTQPEASPSGHHTGETEDSGAEQDDHHGDHGEHDGDSQPTHIQKPVDHQAEPEASPSGHHTGETEDSGAEHHDQGECDQEVCPDRPEDDETGPAGPSPPNETDFVEASAPMFKVADAGALLSMLLMVLLT